MDIEKLVNQDKLAAFLHTNAGLDRESIVRIKALSLPTSCTTLGEDDPFVQFAQPGDLFCLPDLVELVDFMCLVRGRGAPLMQAGDGMQ